MKLTINQAARPQGEERETLAAPPKWENGMQFHAPLGTNKYGDLSNNCDYVAEQEAAERAKLA